MNCLSLSIQMWLQECVSVTILHYLLLGIVILQGIQMCTHGRPIYFFIRIKFPKSLRDYIDFSKLWHNTTKKSSYSWLFHIWFLLNWHLSGKPWVLLFYIIQITILLQQNLSRYNNRFKRYIPSLHISRMICNPITWKCLIQFQRYH